MGVCVCVCVYVCVCVCCHDLCTQGSLKYKYYIKFCVVLEDVMSQLLLLLPSSHPYVSPHHSDNYCEG